MKRFVLTLLLLTLSDCIFGQVTAVPNAMNFQGRLAKPDGTPVPDGTYSVRFRLYDALTGGSVKFEQTLSTVTVRKGTFAVTLTGFAAGTFQGNLWLGIKIGADAELAPRQPLVTVPFAFKADSVKDNAITGASIANGSLTNADLAAGTLNPLAWLIGGNSGSNPAAQFLGTTDNQPLAFRTNNTEKMRLLANGNVGIGTNNPQALLDVRGNVNVGTANLPLGLTHELGGNTPLLNLDVNFRQPNKNNTFRGGAIRIDTRGNLPLFQFLTRAAGTTVESIPLVVTESGNVGIGTTTPRNKLTVTGGVEISGSGSEFIALYASNNNSNNGVGIAGIANSGAGAIGVAGESDFGWGIYSYGRAGGSSGWEITSDARYKQNVATLQNPLDTILHLRGVTFDWKRDEFKGMNFTRGRQVGFIAQEVEPILPEIVHTDGKGYKSVIYANVVPVLVEAIKQQQGLLMAQQQQRETDRAEIKAVKAENAQLRADHVAVQQQLATLLARLEKVENATRK